MPNINNKQSISTDPKGEKISNGQLFNVFVTFDNHSSEKNYPMPNRNIIELAIEENLLHWPYRGYIIYANKFEGIERNDDPNAWFYRMDARDEVNIKIKLASDDQQENELPREVWEIDLDFVIYDTEDLPAANIATKVKKIYFWDKRYQMMMDKKIFWSTVTAQKLKNASSKTDDERSMFTGDAIEKLLTEPDAAGYEDSIDTENWDKGTIELMYTSPSQNNIADDLSSLLSSHLTEKEDDMALFKYNNRVDKKWQLIPLHKFFEKAGSDVNTPGEWQLEHFFFEDIESEDQNTSPYRAPYSQGLNFE
jgi:hypothetical protein